MVKKELISIIIPCYNEEEAIPVFYKEINKITEQMNSLNFEFIFINDGSKDNTENILNKLSEEDKRVHYITFSKNFGKEAGMLAGLEKSQGDYVALMDVDLQDPPEMLKTMYHYLTEEYYDCCALYTRTHEGYSLIRKLLTSIWYRLITKLSKSNEKPGARDFRLMTRQMVNSILECKEYNRYMKGIFDFIGYKTKWIAYDAPNRKAGKSKFNIRSLAKYAIEGIISSSTAPLLLSTYIGLFFCLISFIAIIVIIIKTILYGDPVSGWPSLSCIVLFVSGVQLFFLGTIGTYISKIYLEVKKRPIYIIKEEK